MKRMLWIFTLLMFCVASVATAQVMTVKAGDGFINEVLEADTLGDGSQAHKVYELVTTDTTYRFSGAFTIKENLTIKGILGSADQRPPCLQPTVLTGGDIPPTLFLINKTGVDVSLKNLYILASATNNGINSDGIAISVSGDDVRLAIDNCVFDGWQTFAIGYNGQWDSFFITNSDFRNFVHPNQHYLGEVLRNTWPGEAYTDTVSFVGNTMLCINGYAAGPVTKWYQKYFEFVDNKVLYTFKNPFFIFNTTEGKINDNFFYANYSGGVDTADEHPWWDNLWVPDSSYGVIALQPLSVHNAKMFCPDDSSKADSVVLAIAEKKRAIEVNNNQYFWPTAITGLWDTWNTTSDTNKIRTPVFMNDRTVAMFANDADYPLLTALGNMDKDPGFMTTLDSEILNGTVDDYNIGFLDYFEQVRTGTAATDIWGYQLIDVTAGNWVPPWPLPETAAITNITGKPNVSVVSKFNLNNVYPNPFNPSTTISWTKPLSRRRIRLCLCFLL